jgi:hypothetical protein
MTPLPYKWLLAKVEGGPRISDVTFFSDEALFHFTNYVNSQNASVW